MLGYQQVPTRSLTRGRMLTAAGGAAAVAALVIYSSRFVGGWAAVRFSRLRHMGVPTLKGKVFVVTGGNRGIGLIVCAKLIAAGATVIMCTRRPGALSECAARQLREGGADVHCMALDLSSLESIAAFAAAFREKFSRLDVLILSAGVAKSMQDSDGFAKTGHGFEECIGVNFLGHFELTLQLLPLLRATEGSRVVAVTSVASANSYPEGINYASWRFRVPYYSDWAQYGQSKLALILFIEELRKREPSLLAVACHPGVCETELTKTGSWLDAIYSRVVYSVLGMRAKDAALNVMWCATAGGLASGEVYHPILGVQDALVPARRCAAGAGGGEDLARRPVGARGCRDRGCQGTGVVRSGSASAAQVGDCAGVCGPTVDGQTPALCFSIFVFAPRAPSFMSGGLWRELSICRLA
ncbi:unnamed protein product [Prorocentrum cordatum]|uniref:Protochlorophyllide reductase n=1 Tax=Prorocentrum cordatum TaxID=2364126 RepID=A0ABN9R1L8_9DINO|nr:unnamed protein product [Polarella glacialis]